MTADVGRWRRIYANEWHAGAFQSLSDGERVVYFYARTGPQTTSVGIFRLSTAVAVEDIGGTIIPTEFDLRLIVVVERCGWLFDPATRVLWIPYWLDENPPQLPNVVRSWRKLLLNLPDCDLKYAAADLVFESLKDKPKAFREAFGKALVEPEPKTEAKPLAKTEPYQGAGSRDPGSRNSEQARSARNAAENENPTTALFTPDLRILKIAHETLQYGDPNGPIEALIDIFHSCAQHSGINGMKRADVIAYLSLARSERARPSNLAADRPT